MRIASPEFSGEAFLVQKIINPFANFVIAKQTETAN
jgi:hypothetical protein